jgi:hypothetical protein
MNGSMMLQSSYHKRIKTREDGDEYFAEGPVIYRIVFS